MSQELDSYLALKRGMKAGSNFKQMMQCRKFGDGNKPGKGMGRGPGGQGKSGFAVSAEPNASVLGNETRITNPSKPGNGGRSENKTNPPMLPAAVEKGGVADGVKPVDRESDAVQGETPIGQYRDLVEKYFKAITK